MLTKSWMPAEELQTARRPQSGPEARRPLLGAHCSALPRGGGNMPQRVSPHAGQIWLSPCSPHDPAYQPGGSAVQDAVHVLAPLLGQGHGLCGAGWVLQEDLRQQQEGGGLVMDGTVCMHPAHGCGRLDARLMGCRGGTGAGERPGWQSERAVGAGPVCFCLCLPITQRSQLCAALALTPRQSRQEHPRAMPCSRQSF